MGYQGLGPLLIHDFSDSASLIDSITDSLYLHDSIVLYLDGLCQWLSVLLRFAVVNSIADDETDKTGSDSNDGC